MNFMGPLQKAFLRIISKIIDPTILCRRMFFLSLAKHSQERLA